jgi:hypothetical protein
MSAFLAWAAANPYPTLLAVFLFLWTIAWTVLVGFIWRRAAKRPPATDGDGWERPRLPGGLAADRWKAELEALEGLSEPSPDDTLRVALLRRRLAYLDRVAGEADKVT